MAFRLLIVDDDRTTRLLLTTAAEARGHVVWAAEDGETALALAAREHPDVVLLDIGLPGIDGRDVISRLKADPGTAHARVFMLSASDDPFTKELCFEYGAEDYFQKPFSARSVLDRLELAVGAPRSR
jgi:two-component system KDP operon response regulator KdpE